MLITLAVPVEDLKMHVINLNDMLAGRQIRKNQAPLWFSHWNEASIEERYTHRKTKIGKISSISSLRKKEIVTHMMQFFHGAIFSCGYRSVLLCFVLF